MATFSKTSKTVSQRKAVAIRRGLGMLALVGLFALPQAPSAQSHAPRGDGDRAEQRVSQFHQAHDLTHARATPLRGPHQVQESNRPRRGARQSVSREAMRAQRETHRAEQNRRIAAIPMPAQSERFRAERHQGQRDGQ